MLRFVLDLSVRDEKFGQNREHHRSRRWSDDSEPRRRARITLVIYIEAPNWLNMHIWKDEKNARIKLYCCTDGQRCLTISCLDKTNAKHTQKKMRCHVRAAQLNHVSSRNSSVVL